MDGRTSFYLSVSPDQIQHRLFADDASGMISVCRHKVPVTGLKQKSADPLHSYLQSTGNDPVRLLFVVRMHSGFHLGPVAPLRNAVTFLCHYRPQQRHSRRLQL